MSKWFLEAMQNAVLAGHLSASGAAKVEEALRREEDEDSDDWTCLICGQDCRDSFGQASKECRRDYNAD